MAHAYISSAPVQLAAAGLRLADAQPAKLLQLFPPQSHLQPAQAGQLGAVTPTRGNVVNMVV